MNLYKVLGKNGEAVNSGNGAWNRNGKWMPPIEGELIPCENGYHLCRREDLIDWFGPTIWEAEHKGEIVEADNKVVVREARITKKLDWDETTARLFAIDCAAHVMHIGDEVVLSTVLAVTYLYAIGEASREDLDAAQVVAGTVAGAAQDAARAARDATRVAAGAAWVAIRAVVWAARNATRAVAWAALDATGAWDVARVAEREWQTERLFEYLQSAEEQQ